MNEIPSSAVTAAYAVLTTSTEAGVGAMAASGIAGSATDAGGFDRADLLALDDAPLDLLLRAIGLVEIAPRPDVPIYAAESPGDWCGVAHDAVRLARLSVPGMDLVFDGAGAGVHMAAGVDFVADPADMLAGAASLADPLVALGPLGAEEAASFPPGHHDAPVHVDVVADDVAADDAARIDLGAPDVRAPELSWLAAVNDHGLHVGEAWAWSDLKGGYVFDHYV
ncbi:hypothetical protein FHP25_28960 [Vineibacter terrae]|uniref:Uncharacterized protein n=1 Tax=Vineibacter terrae TaxID=2586908 RepID=A0A5C8PD95_9HYPH|nr:hypothetical protein [Vineibacter terrae]TXL71722.1 hypothetical protein FHP25_28960 [Vineibacter terrae]